MNKFFVPNEVYEDRITICKVVFIILNLYRKLLYLAAL